MGEAATESHLATLYGRIAELECRFEDQAGRLRTAEADRDRYRKLVEHAADGLVVHDGEGRFLAVNPRAAAILGYSEEELLCLGLKDVEPDFDAFGIRQRLEGMSPGDVLTVEGKPRRRDGAPVVVEVRVGLLQSRPRQYVAFLRDITDRKETVRGLEESSLRFKQLLEGYQANLVQVERLATFGTLGAGVGHELNNLAQIFLAASEMLALEARPSELVSRVASEIQHASESLVLHARHLLAAGRPPSEEGEVIDLGRELEETAGLLRRAGRLKRTRVELGVAPRQHFVSMSRARLEQIVINLLMNAAEALEERSGCVSTHAFEQAGRIHLVVSDEGCGISDEALPRVFEPYFTTKRHHVGLGLLVVRQIVRDAGGDVQVHSEVDQGTSVECVLPKAEHAPRIIG